MERVARDADKAMGRLGRDATGTHAASFDARALVSDVLGELFTGDLIRDDEALETQIAREVRRRVKRERRRGHHLVSLDAFGGDDHPDRIDESIDERARDRECHAALAAIVPALRARLAKNAHACAVLALFEIGVTERAEVLARTGLTERQYKSAFDRITYATRVIVANLAPADRERVAAVAPIGVMKCTGARSPMRCLRGRSQRVEPELREASTALRA
ncbi:MAG TPA: hypothetical protein VGM88_11680 [Kofleriaceae bacterium]